MLPCEYSYGIHRLTNVFILETYQLTLFKVLTKKKWHQKKTSYESYNLLTLGTSLSNNILTL